MSVSNPTQAVSQNISARTAGGVEIKVPHRAVYESLKQSIEEGGLRPGDRIPGEQELMSRYQATRHTVLRALTQLRDEGVLNRIQGAGTFVSDSNHKGGTMRFAFVASGSFGVHSRFTIFGQLESEIAHHLRDNYGAHLILQPVVNASDTEERRMATIETAIEEGAVGVFFLPMEGDECDEANNRRLLNRLDEADVPVVLLDNAVQNADGSIRHDLIGLNNFEAGREIGVHLRNQGASRVVFVERPTPPLTVLDRLRGLEAGLGPQAEVCRTISHQSDIQKVAEEFKPDAMVGKDDQTAANVMRVLYKMGLVIPGDIMVTGFDDSLLASESIIPLTTFAQPHKYMARAAVDVMLSRLSDRGQPVRSVSLSGELVIRESTRRQSNRDGDRSPRVSAER